MKVQIRKKARTIFSNLKFGSALLALVCISNVPTTSSASPIPVGIAKKCHALAAKAFPPRVPGNPAAGSAKGTPRTKSDYFKKCVANGGNTDKPPAQ
jgi:hypothetical protein